MKLILASGSAIRGRILRDAGIPHEMKKGSAPEPSPEPGESADAYVVRCAEAKARAIWDEFRDEVGDRIVVGCDQVVEFRSKILRKVDSPEAAVERLMTLQQAPHALVNGLVILVRGEVARARSTRVQVMMRHLSREQIERYVAVENPLVSVACYLLESQGIKLIEAIDGAWHAALGLPLDTILDELCHRGIPLFPYETEQTS